MKMSQYKQFLKVPQGIQITDLHNMKRTLFEQSICNMESFRPHAPLVECEHPIQIIDFFSGAGGTSLGFSALATILPIFRFLGGCDINQVSAMTYSHNYNTPILNEDILEIAQDINYIDNFLERINYNKNLPTVLIGCAPCQGFSSHRKKHWDEEDDDRNNLVIAFSKIVDRISPVAFIMENVPEFLSEKYWKYYSKAKENFQNSGYIVKSSIYNAAEFGVPQERFRSIIIGMKKEFVLPSSFYGHEQYKTVRDAIGTLSPVLAGQRDLKDTLHKSVAHKQSTLDVIRQVPHDGGNRPEGVGPKCLEKVSGFSDVYGRLSWDKPSITITHYARNPASGRYVHPEQDRGLTAREAARLQSFPDGFEFKGKFDDIYRQIGEAVPPRFACGIVVNLVIELLSDPPTGEQLEEGRQSIERPVSNSYSSVIAGIKNMRRQT